MVQGLACYIKFDSAQVEDRFLSWVKKGNLKSQAMGYSSLMLEAHVLKVDESEYLFLWSHMFPLSLGWFLRFMLWMQLRKVRKESHISSVNKLQLVDDVIRRGFKE